MKSHVIYLEDIIEAIDVIREIAGEGTAARIAANRRDRAAFERCFEILSEATKHLDADFKEGHPEIPWRQIVGLGNVLRHDYARVETSILHTIARQDIPLLETVCRDELRRIEALHAGEDHA